MYLHGVGGPEDESVGTDGDEESAELGALGGGVGAAVQGQVPDDEEVGNAGNGVPAPLLGSTLLTERSEEAGEDHDQVGNDGHDDVSTRHASEETKIEDQEGGGQAPVDVTGPEDLAVDLGERVWDVVVLVADRGLLDTDAVSGGHGEVREGGEDGDHDRDGVVQALRLATG
jgi:hypothetical protein